ncbi:uncharacterized protein LOC143072853 [Mytilus galloprovincialis]|uniref:uncharacterized protein LOC143072853 n=1 Tax=Mytilus galloprovincialis TaxID=29158 RepID=UPI003F7CB888
MLMPTFSSNQDNSVHIPDMLPWQPRRAIDLQPTVDNTQFVSQTGCGAYFDGKWAQYKWPEAWSNMPIMRDITFLELVPIVLAMFIWASNFQNRKILFRFDNMELVSIINKRTAKSKRVMAFIRPLVLFTMQHNIQFKAQHIDGCKNEIADSISRFQLKRFRELAPGAESVPENNPEEFRDLILSLKQTD